MYIINDKNLIEDIKNEFAAIVKTRESEFSNLEFDHPLDSGSIEKLSNLMSGSAETIEYSQVGALDILWNELIDKAIKCLRYFDEREPFLKNSNKTPVSYGIDKLRAYHERYSNFESLLYGASSYYRDHVFHSVRTWMLGVFCLLKGTDLKEEGSTIESDTIFIDKLTIEGDSKNIFINNTNFFEKISMWTLIALCHDLGYPLEKSQQILDKTQKMMKEFIPNPNIWNNFNFSGIQDSINEYIVKFVSTKMKKIEDLEGCENQNVKDYVFHGRIQPKYYLKYTKSLENFDHGIVSSVIIYKMLLYFLESDFNLNDDYIYKYEDARQFYIRREILRAMASHTCSDVYNIYLTTFSSMLFLCDELQEWGRKSWNEMYAGLQPNAVKLSIEKFTPTEVDVIEEIDMGTIDKEVMVIENIVRIFIRQYEKYKVIFRDGQYTQARDFNLTKRMKLQLAQSGTQGNEISIVYTLKAQEENRFEVNLKASKYKSSSTFKKELENKISKSEFAKEFHIVSK